MSKGMDDDFKREYVVYDPMVNADHAEINKLQHWKFDIPNVLCVEMAVSEDDQREYKWWEFQIRKTPCLLKSLFYGAIGGMSVGAIHYASRRVFIKAFDYGIVGYVATSISAWGICRYKLAKRRIAEKKHDEITSA